MRRAVAVWMILVPVMVFSGSEGRARDCAALHQAVKQERSLLKRRQLFEEAVRQCPENAALHFDYGYTLERLRRYHEALEQYGLTVRLDPELAKAYFNMGDVYRLLGEEEKARTMYEKGLALEPGNTRAGKRLEELGRSLRVGEQ